MTRLAPPLPLSNNWLHALEIVFLVDRSVLLPLAQREDKVALVETPDGYKLLIDLLLSKGSRAPPGLPGGGSWHRAGDLPPPERRSPCRHDENVGVQRR